MHSRPDRSGNRIYRFSLCLAAVGCTGGEVSDPMDLMDPDPRISVANFLEVYTGDRPATDTERMYEAMDAIKHRYPRDYNGIAIQIDRALAIPKSEERKQELRRIAAELRTAAAEDAETQRPSEADEAEAG